MKKLHNTEDKRILKERIAKSTEPRTTVSFYKYANISDPQQFRDDLFINWSKLDVLGRTYVASEGINAQISLPTANFEKFKEQLYSISFLDGVRLNTAVEDNGKSFFALRLKVRPKIVADGIDDPNFDPSNTGKYWQLQQVLYLFDLMNAVNVCIFRCFRAGMKGNFRMMNQNITVLNLGL